DVVRQPGQENGVALARQYDVAVVQVEVVREPEDVRLVVAVDAGVAVHDERVEPVLVHQRARERAATLHLGSGEASDHAVSCSRIQSAASGRYRYGMLLQTWLPSSKSTHVEFGAA